MLLSFLPGPCTGAPGKDAAIVGECKPQKRIHVVVTESVKVFRMEMLLE
jgi:hypothetical protein